MFLINVNIKASSCGSPLVNDDNELVGLVSDPAYLIEGSKDLVLPGTWICAVPAGLTFPPRAGESPALGVETTDAQAAADAAAADLLSELSKPKKKAAGGKKPAPKKKAKGKKK